MAKEKRQAKKRGLVMCRTGMGSSMMIRIKVDKIIRDNNYPLELSHDVLGANVKNFDVIITMHDLIAEAKLEETGKYLIGIKDIMDVEFMKEELEKYFEQL